MESLINLNRVNEFITNNTHLDENGNKKPLRVGTPYVIEAFDNSNLFGTDAVSSMVVFVNGKPSRRDYRKYKIKTLENKASDYHTMKEVVYRRYYKVLMENLRKPDLILVDGGLQQINAANEIITDLGLNIPIAGLVKVTSLVFEVNVSS